MINKRRHFQVRDVLPGVKTWFGRHQRAVKITAGVLLVIVGLQLAYPGSRALPLAKLGGDRIGFASDQSIASKLQVEYGKTTVTSKIRGTDTTVPLAESGLVIDNERVLAGVSNYPWYLKLIPLSSVVKGALTNQPVVVKADPIKFSVYAQERIKECAVAPKNAGVVVKDGEVELDPAKDGQRCTEESLRRQLTEPELSKNGLTVNVRTDAVKPDRSDRDVQPLLAKAREVAEHELTLNVAGRIYEVDKPTLASWLAFPEDPATKQPTVGLNDEAVKKYLNTIQKDIYIAPGVTVITTVDSIETGRVTGRSGQGIDQATTIEAIRKQVLAGDGQVTASLAVLPPTLSYNRSYSKTPEGLQALVNDLVRDKGNMAISVRKLGDSGVHANGDKQYHPASTYKLFVAYSVLKRVDDGRMSLGQTTSGGQTLAQCLDNMIVNSDNACAEWFGVSISWNTLTTEARALGASRTVLSRPFVSTANDQALFLQKLESNQLGLSEPSRARLLDAMKRQIFRKGIPAGVGVPVADKVGFIPDEGLWHDSAIVYAPSGVYVLVIYTQGGSWGSIADAARQIHAQLKD